MSRNFAIKLNGQILPEVYDSPNTAGNKLPDALKRYIEQNHSRSGNLQFDIVEVKLSEVPALEVVK